MGSLAFTAAARVVHMVTTDPDDRERRLMLPAKSNLGRDNLGMAYRIVDAEHPTIGPSATIQWEPEPVPMHIHDLMERQARAARARPQASPATDAASGLVRDALIDGPLPATEVFAIAELAGVGETSIKRAKARLGVETVREGFGKGARYVWRLPAGAERDARQGALFGGEQA